MAGTSHVVQIYMTEQVPIMVSVVAPLTPTRHLPCETAKIAEIAGRRIVHQHYLYVLASQSHVHKHSMLSTFTPLPKGHAIQGISAIPAVAASHPASHRHTMRTVGNSHVAQLSFHCQDFLLTTWTQAYCSIPVLYIVHIICCIPPKVFAVER